MAIQMKRQGGGKSSTATAKVPSSLEYGEIAVDSAGNIYTANGAQKIVSQVKNAANVLFLYKGVYPATGWTAYSGYWTQTVSVTPQDGGPALTNNFVLASPLTSQTDSQATNESKQEALGLIASGKATPGNGQVTCKVFEKPTIDLDVYWYARQAGGYDSMVETGQLGSVVENAVQQAVDEIKDNIVSITNDAIEKSGIYDAVNQAATVYYAVYKAANWESSSSNGYLYTQTVTVQKTKSNSADITADSIFLTPGFFLPTGVSSTDETLSHAMGIINNGYSVSGSNTVTTKVSVKPTCDITVRWVVQSI